MGVMMNSELERALQRTERLVELLAELERIEYECRVIQQMEREDGEDKKED